MTCVILASVKVEFHEKVNGFWVFNGQLQLNSKGVLVCISVFFVIHKNLKFCYFYFNFSCITSETIRLGPWFIYKAFLTYLLASQTSLLPGWKWKASRNVIICSCNITGKTKKSHSMMVKPLCIMDRPQMKVFVVKYFQGC